jgi:hypothetical protein
MLDDGLVIIGVRHQVRDNGGAMEALLTVEFPGVTPPPLVAAHRWHLAVEFSNWIVASTANRPARNHDADQTGRLVRRSVLPG